MSIYVSGMEMPTGDNNITLFLYPDGKVVMCGMLGPLGHYEAIHVPEHGRLIDADALAEMLEKYKKEYALKAKEDIVHLHKAWGLHEAELMAESLPTFIPADPADKEGEG